MGGAMLAESGATMFRPQSERCPLAPKAPAAVHRDAFADRVQLMSFYQLHTCDAVREQTESKFRISQSRSRQKRGPPSLGLS